MSVFMRVVWLVVFVAWSGTLAAQEFPQSHHQADRYRSAVVRPTPSRACSSTRCRGLLGHSMVIENRAGAGGLLGVNAVAKSTPDGYTIGSRHRAASR
jgi:hypothetical protein